MNNMFSESPHGKVGVVAHACKLSTLQMEKSRPPPHSWPPSGSLKPAYAFHCQQEKSTAMVSPMGVKNACWSFQNQTGCVTTNTGDGLCDILIANMYALTIASRYVLQEIRCSD